eukprot:1248542-Pleurochrysis_carterae.AAC.1
MAASLGGIPGMPRAASACFSNVRLSSSDALPCCAHVALSTHTTSHNSADGSEQEFAAETLARPPFSHLELVPFLAQHYRVRGAPAAELCAHNAVVADAAALPQLAHTWRALCATLATPPLAPTLAATSDGDGDGGIGEGERAGGGGGGARVGGGGAGAGGGVGDVRCSSKGSPASSPATATNARKASAANQMRLAVTPVSANGSMLTLLVPVVRALLEHHCENGDAQTCAVICQVLRKEMPSLVEDQR